MEVRRSWARCTSRSGRGRWSGRWSGSTWCCMLQGGPQHLGTPTSNLPTFQPSPGFGPRGQGFGDLLTHLLAPATSVLHPNLRNPPSKPTVSLPSLSLLTSTYYTPSVSLDRYPERPHTAIKVWIVDTFAFSYARPE